MQPKIENAIELLKDGKWHTIEEISQKTRLHKFKIELLADFLADYSFIEFNKKQQKAKSSKAFAEFLKKHRAPV
jgi:hypothetical protein